jgi:hypothetical protein
MYNMYRFLLSAFSLLLLLLSCTPPVKTIPRKVQTGFDSTTYVGVVDMEDIMPNFNRARPFAKVKVKDRGWSLDCLYPEVLQLAREKAMDIGGNMLVITSHRKPENDRSRCDRIQAEVYRVQRLEGMEAKIFWHPDRRLDAADLRGRAGDAFPPVVCRIRHRLLGDFFNTIQVRTITTFLSDSTGRADTKNSAWDVRRAQLHFDMAELQSRIFKDKIAALAPDLTEMTKQARPLIAEAQNAFSQQVDKLDSALRGSANPEQVLSQWESDVHRDLDKLQHRAGDQFINLKPPKKRS